MAKPHRILTGLFALSVLATTAHSAIAKPITVTSEPVTFHRILPQTRVFGQLRFLGGIEISSPAEAFGGFSSLVISADGRKILSTSDDGWWFRAGLIYRDQQLIGVENAELSPLLRQNGKRSSNKTNRDAEALSLVDPARFDGRVLVGYERNTRLELFDLSKPGLGARPVRQFLPPAIGKGPENKELEAISRLSDGTYIALSERHLDEDGNIKGWAWKGTDERAFSIKRLENFLITDMALLPGEGQFLTLERAFPPAGMAVRKFSLGALKQGATMTGELLFSGRQPLYNTDNMEGLAVHQNDAGETVLTIISDDNFNRTIQSTLILQFALGK